MSSRPTQADWKPVFGYTSTNQSSVLTPIAAISADNELSINNINTSNTLQHRWLTVNNDTKVFISQRIDTIGSYNSARNMVIGDM